MHFDLLKRLCETPGIAGREEQMRTLVREEMRSLVHEMRVDALGNLVGVRWGSGAAPRRRVMIAAHMDEIGFIVRFIDEKGFVRLQPVGGFDARNLVAQRVLVHPASGPSLRGVLYPAIKPTHLLAGEDPKPVKTVTELFVDLGLPAERVRETVEIGDMVTLDRTAERVGDTVVSKSLDDRVGVFVMLEALRALTSHSVDIYAVATVQEEVGLRGASTAAYGLTPDIGVALDTTLAVDIPGIDAQERVTTLGGGIAIKVMDSASISHPKLVRQMRDIARSANIPHQLEVLPRGGTDAAAQQRARAGAAVITLSIPSRYVHTVNEMVHTSDVQAGIDLLVRFLTEAHTLDIAY